MFWKMYFLKQRPREIRFRVTESTERPQMVCSIGNYLKVTKFSDTLNLAILCLMKLAHTKFII